MVIAILIALQINNWNEQRKSNEKFNAVLEQIYTIIDQDVQSMLSSESRLILQSNIIDSLMLSPKKLDKTLFPSLVYYTDVIPDEFSSEAAHQMNLLEFNPNNFLQSHLYKSIASYAFDKLEFERFSAKRISKLLMKFDFPEPTLVFRYSTLNNYENIDRSFFTKEQQERAVKLVHQAPFKTVLQSAKSQNKFATVSVQNKKMLRLQFWI